MQPTHKPYNEEREKQMECETVQIRKTKEKNKLNAV